MIGKGITILTLIRATTIVPYARLGITSTLKLHFTIPFV